MKLIIVLETKAMDHKESAWSLARLHETEESLAILGEMRYEVMITDNLSVAFQPPIVLPG